MSSVNSSAAGIGTETLLGIIGGLGPHAGVDVYQKLLANTLANKDQHHLDVILASLSSRVPDRTAWLEQRHGPNPAYGMFESASRLYAAGVRLALVACNTAHARPIFSVFRELVDKQLPGLELLHLVDCCRDWMDTATTLRRPGLLATRGTFLAEVYNEAFAALPGMQLVVPETRTQQAVHRSIYDESFGIKACAKPVSQQSLDILLAAIGELADRGADSIILGCTELSLALTPDLVSLPLVYPTVLAVRELIHRVRPESLSAAMVV